MNISLTAPLVALVQEKVESGFYNIAAHTLEDWGERQLGKYRAVLEKALAEITRNPLSIRSKSRDELFPGCRSLHAGRQLILYRVKGRSVEIARILHDSPLPSINRTQPTKPCQTS